MKYLHKFNESFSQEDFELTNKDFVTIENCFLEYIDHEICTASHGINIVFFNFTIETQKDDTLHTKYQKLSEIVSGMSGDIKRCGSYGYECMFSFKELFSPVPPHSFHLVVAKPGFFNFRFGDYRKDALETLGYDEAITHIMNILQDPKSNK